MGSPGRPRQLEFAGRVQDRGQQHRERELWRFAEDPLQSLAECRSVHDSLKPQKNLSEELKRKIPKDQGSLRIVCTPTNQVGKTLQFKRIVDRTGIGQLLPMACIYI